MLNIDSWMLTLFAGLLLGAGIGFWFRVPAALAASIVIAVADVALSWHAGAGIWDTAISAVLAIVALQVGYVAGRSLGLAWRRRTP